MRPARRLAEFVAACALGLAATGLVLMSAGSPRPPAAASLREAAWRELGRADMAATATSTSTTTTTAPPVPTSKEPASCPDCRWEPGETGGPAATDRGLSPSHEEASPPLGGSTAGGTLASIRACESGGDYAYDDGQFHGAYNFDHDTWVAAGGSTTNADQASAAEQDQVAARWIASGHRGSWPNC